MLNECVAILKFASWVVKYEYFADFSFLRHGAIIHASAQRLRGENVKISNVFSVYFSPLRHHDVPRVED